MSQGGKKPDSPPPKRTTPATDGPATWVRVLVSLVLLLHVVVLFLYPWANGRTSTTIAGIANWPAVRWYADILYLNHGHGFFGPDPGAGFLIEYEVRGAQGEVVAEGRFPDADRTWPRLRYHRFKMMADQLESPRINPEQLLRGYARQLIRQYDGESATVTQVVHRIANHGEWMGDEARGVRAMPLDDKSLYRQLRSVRQTRADVEAADNELLGPTTEDANPAPEAVSGGLAP